MQRTIKNETGIAGVGLHTGCEVEVRLVPAPPDTGIVFRRTDLQDFEIPALRQHVSRVVLATTLMKRGVMLSTVEHLMSAIHGLAIDNLFIDINSLEVPILDGSAQPFVELINQSGRRQQNKDRVFLKVTRELEVRDRDKYIRVTPADELRITYEIDFAHPAIGNQRLDLVITPGSYTREICFARTFGFLAEVEQLRKSNLIRGGSLDNAVVLTEDGVLNGALRAPDEFVRHKTLDLLGDIALCGYPVLGHIQAYKAGHALHTDLATQLARNSRVRQLLPESDLANCA